MDTHTSSFDNHSQSSPPNPTVSTPISLPISTSTNPIIPPSSSPTISTTTTSLSLNNPTISTSSSSSSPTATTTTTSTTTTTNNNNNNINNNSATTTANNNNNNNPRTMLDDLLHERAAIEPIRRAVPHLWSLLDAEIARLSNSNPDTKAAATLSSLAAGIIRSSPLSTNLSLPSLTTSTQQQAPTPTRRSSSPPANRKRVKIPVPADRFPEYNFVGRLLGPRGTTLKTLERDYGCKIMIRGKGSIRKDKEPDVRGKPGWEHVFNEPLHVVIEVSDTLDDTTATKTLNRAKAAVQVLLVPVPEEQDGLKREQLRALAIMNGTYRGGPARSHDQLPIPQSLSNSHLVHPPHPVAPNPAAAAVAASGFSMDNQHNLFMGNSNAAAASTPNLMSAFDHSLDDTSIYHSIQLSRPFDLFESKSFPLQHQQMPIQVNTGEKHSPSSGDTSPNHNLFDHVSGNTDQQPNDGISSLASKLQRCSVDEFATSSVGDDSPDSSHTSDDGEPSTQITNTTTATSANYSNNKVKVTALSPNNNRTETSLSAGGFIGQEFYNGAFSNGPSPNSWDQPSSSAPLSFSSGLYNESPIPSPQVLTTSTSTISPIDRHNGY